MLSKVMGVGALKARRRETQGVNERVSRPRGGVGPTRGGESEA